MTKPSKFITWGFSVIFLLVTTGLVYADSGFYAGASVGRTMLDENLAGLPIDDEATAFRANVGLEFSNNISFEAGYMSLGEFEIDSLDGILEGEVDGGTLSAVFSLPLTNNLSLTTRGGIFFWDAVVENDAFIFEEEGEDLFYGIGVRADLSDQFSIVGEWDRIEFDDAETDILFAGFNFKF